MEFATKSMSYISPHSTTTKQNTKDRNWQKSAARNTVTLVNVHKVNKYDKRNNMELNYMLKISHFHTNTHTEMFEPLITCMCHSFLLKKHARHQSYTASVHRRHKLGRPASAFLRIFSSQAGSDLCCWVSQMW